MNFKKALFFIPFFFAGILSFSCNSRRTVELIKEEETAILPDIMWVLVTVPYASVREDCSFSAGVISQVREGEIYAVAGSRVVEYKASKDEDSVDPQLWYKIEPGWVEAHNVRIFDTKLKALNAAR